MPPPMTAQSAEAGGMSPSVALVPTSANGPDASIKSWYDGCRRRRATADAPRDGVTPEAFAALI